ncbi:MAG: hypothetical protein BWY95_02089 [Bacteroidetes bacterium ADurb.BinA104]|nr:MAG: hypothetical protein BWY95_02089 [Bacteroidetes bacterium ADurb.BinA104]
MLLAIPLPDHSQLIAISFCDATACTTETVSGIHSGSPLFVIICIALATSSSVAGGGAAGTYFVILVGVMFGVYTGISPYS